MTSRFTSILYRVYIFWFSTSSWTQPPLLTRLLKYFRTENLTRVMLTKFVSWKIVYDKNLSLLKGSRYFLIIYIEFWREVVMREREDSWERSLWTSARALGTYLAPSAGSVVAINYPQHCSELLRVGAVESLDKLHNHFFRRSNFTHRPVMNAELQHSRLQVLMVSYVNELGQYRNKLFHGCRPTMEVVFVIMSESTQVQLSPLSKKHVQVV